MGRGIVAFGRLAALLALLGGCAGEVTSAWRPERVVLSSDAGANGGHPVDVDVVLSHDPARTRELRTLEAASWFGRPRSFGPDSDNSLTVYSFEVPPALAPAHKDIAGGRPADALFVFARYGEGRLRGIELREGRAIAVHLDRTAPRVTIAR